MYLDQEPEPKDAVAWVHEAVGAPIDVEILAAQPWSGHCVVARSYRAGRVFLASDAAHLPWPKGGFGANTGIGDAVDLGWKLAAVLEGWGGPALLDSYELERRPPSATSPRHRTTGSPTPNSPPIPRSAARTRRATGPAVRWAR